jgi:hypothetical protein
MRKILMLAILCLTGCAYNIDSLPPSASGNDSDIHRFINLKIQPLWESQVLTTSIKFVGGRLRYPETAVFDGDPVITAYYDKDKTNSWLQLTGHAHSFSPNGAVSHQTYIVDWEQDGNAATNKDTDWDFQSIDVLNDDPSDRGY